MAKLHELLAAESNVAAAYKFVSDETINVFGKPDHFVRAVTVDSYFNEEDHKLNKTETKNNVTTVDDRLKYTFGRPFTSRLNLLAQKDRTNQEARADVVVNGEVLLKGVPATTLLSLETMLADKRRELSAIPTLSPGLPWVWDEHVVLWKTSEPQVSFRTKKTIRPIVMHEGSKEHPAQVQPVSEDIPVARIEKTVYSGMATSGEKADIIARLDALIVAVKKARQRANRADVVKLEIGNPIAAFILNGPEADEIGADDESAAT